MQKDYITIRGERKLWIKFVNKLREENKEVWKWLKPKIRKYLGRK